LFEDDFDATVQADLNQNYLLEIKVYGLLKWLSFAVRL
jgi:hypothetical protein